MMLDTKRIVENNTIRLRPMVIADTDKFWKLTEHGLIWTYFTSDLSEYSELLNWVKMAIADKDNGKRLPLTILHKQTNSILGSTSLGNYSPKDKRIEIGWTWIGSDYQGKGYNDTSKQLLLNYCFSELQLVRVEFKTDVLNHPARKALVRIGATEEGILRSHTLMPHNRRRDTIYYSLLSHEWET